MPRLASAPVLAAVLVARSAAAHAYPVTAAGETDPVASSGDAADDSCVWLHPTDPARSTIIATDKQRGLLVHDLTGAVLQELPDGEMNNVDLRHAVMLGGRRVDVVVAANRSDDSLAVYTVDPDAGTLTPLATLDAGVEVYGTCLYRSAATGDLHVFVNDKDGVNVQLRLGDDGAGLVAEEVRRFDAGDQVEGCVADDELGAYYVGEEEVGIWRYGAEPDAGEERSQVDATGAGHLTADVEGLALYRGGGGTGYLIASSQGDSSFAVYRRDGENEYVTGFEVVDGDAIDGVSGTDGIEVTGAALGPAFPAGLFIAQDGDNAGDNQNYKLVGWDAIALAASPALVIDTSYDPRGGAGPDEGGGGDEADGGPVPGGGADSGAGPGETTGGDTSSSLACSASGAGSDGALLALVCLLILRVVHRERRAAITA